jgi:prolyl oligopeptidase
LPLPGPATVAELVPLPGGSVLYDISTYLRPPYFARYDESRGTSTETALAQTNPVSFQDAQALREYATSKDGTRVPLNIIRSKGTVLDGHNPVLLTGYGGDAMSLTPGFVGPRARLWLDPGGVFVIANLRGGDEYGKQWHLAGNLTHKQNVFDDFDAAARYLIAARYTTPDKLAIIGGSNGGLLMAASFTQHPELYRVNPAHSRKMIARLQAAPAEGPSSSARTRTPATASAARCPYASASGLTSTRSSSIGWGSPSRCALMQAQLSLPLIRRPGDSRSATHHC